MISAFVGEGEGLPRLCQHDWPQQRQHGAQSGNQPTLNIPSKSSHLRFPLLLQQIASTTMTLVYPKRIVLKCPERHWKTQNEMLKTFFDSQGLELDLLDKDLYMHILLEPSSPSHLFFVLDLYCKTIPDINLHQLELQIFQVSKNEPLYVRFLLNLTIMPANLTLI